LKGVRKSGRYQILPTIEEEVEMEDVAEGRRL
jgi:hypothetical protein